MEETTPNKEGLMAKYIATDADGGQHTRTSPRTYTHIVLVHRVQHENDPVETAKAVETARGWLANAETESAVERYTRTLAEYEALAAAATGERSWVCLGWCGRYDLAVKLQAKHSKNLKPGDSIEIVEVRS